MISRERIRSEIREELAKHKLVEPARMALELLAEMSIRFVEEDGSAGYQVLNQNGQPRAKIVDGKTVDLTIPDLVAELRDKHSMLFPRANDAGPPMVGPTLDIGQPAEAEAARPFAAGAGNGEPTLAHLAGEPRRRSGAPADQAPIGIGRASSGALRPRRRVLYGVLAGAVAVLLIGVWGFKTGPHPSINSPAARSEEASAASAVAPVSDEHPVEALAQERKRAEALARDLWAARAELAALKPQAATQETLTQERQKADQREAELQQACQKAEILERLVELKREEALKRDLQAMRADVAPKPAVSGQNGPTEHMLTANRASLDPPSGQSVQAQRASDGAGQGGAQVVQRASPGSIVAGLPEVVNNATLRINGSIIRLIGVEPAPEAEREQMARYLGDRTVTCWPVSSGVRYRCEVDGNDLSRVVLYNGGGRATSDATPELLAEEKHARSARVGIWRE